MTMEDGWEGEEDNISSSKKVVLIIAFLWSFLFKFQNIDVKVSQFALLYIDCLIDSGGVPPCIQSASRR